MWMAGIIVGSLCLSSLKRKVHKLDLTNKIKIINQCCFVVAVVPGFFFLPWWWREPCWSSPGEKTPGKSAPKCSPERKHSEHKHFTSLTWRNTTDSESLCRFSKEKKSPLLTETLNPSPQPDPAINVHPKCVCDKWFWLIMPTYGLSLSRCKWLIVKTVFCVRVCYLVAQIHQQHGLQKTDNGHNHLREAN